MVAVAYSRWSFTSLSLGRFWCFGLAVAYGGWSLTRGGRTWRFDVFTFLKKPIKLLPERLSRASLPFKARILSAQNVV